MAQFWEDWSSATIGDAPTGWTKRYATANATQTVEANASGPAGRRLKITTSTWGGIRGLTWDAIDADPNRANIKIRMLVHGPIGGGGANTFCGVLARGSGATNSEQMYASVFRQDGTTAQDFVTILRKVIGGTTTQLQASPKPSTIDALGAKIYWLGIECNGTTIRHTLAEKDTPGTLIVDQTVTDSAISAAGWAGIYWFSEQTYYVYAIGVGTNGDDAPTAAISGGIALAGAAGVSVAAAGDLTTSAVKGIRVQLGDGSPAANLTGLSVRWWNGAHSGAPAYASDTATTNASGWLTLDLSAVTSLNIGDLGYLHVFKLGATTADDIVAAGRVAVGNIA